MKRFLSSVFLLFVFSINGIPPTFASPTTRPTSPATRPTTKQSLPVYLGSLSSPNPQRTLLHLLRLRTETISKQLQKWEQRLLVQLLWPTFWPGENFDLTDFFSSLVRGIHTFRISQNQPIQIALWMYQKKRIFVAQFQIEQAPKKWLREIGVKAKMEPIPNSKDAWVTLPMQRGQALTALQRGSRLHVFLRPPAPKAGVIESESNIRHFAQAYFKTISQKPTTQQRKPVLSARAKKHLFSTPADLVLQFQQPSRILYRSKWKRSATRLLHIKRATFAFSFQTGIQYRSWIHWDKQVSSLLHLLQPFSKRSGNWGRWLPRDVAWISLANLHPTALANMPKHIQTQRMFPPSLWLTLNYSLSRFQAQLRLPKSLSPLQEFDGRIASGMLWDPQIQQRVLHWKQWPNTRHRAGNFLLLGLRKNANALFWLQAAQRFLHTTLRMRHPSQPSVKTLLQTSQQIHTLTVTPPKSPPFYLIAYKQILLIASDQVTRDRFLDVWQKKSPNFEEVTQRQPHLRKALQSNNLTWFHPPFLKTLLQSQGSLTLRQSLAAIWPTLREVSMTIQVHKNQLAEAANLVIKTPNSARPPVPPSSTDSPQTHKYPKLVTPPQSGWLVLSALAIPLSFPLHLELGTQALRLMDYLNHQRIQLARAELCQFMQEIEFYYEEQQAYPSRSEGLMALVRAQTWPGPIPKDNVFRDPWGRPYQYHVPKEAKNKPFVYSLGVEGDKNALQRGTAIQCPPIAETKKP